MKTVTVTVKNLVYGDAAKYGMVDAVCVDSKGNTYVRTLDLDYFRDRFIKVDIGLRLRIDVVPNNSLEQAYLVGR